LQLVCYRNQPIPAEEKERLQKDMTAKLCVCCFTFCMGIKNYVKKKEIGMFAACENCQTRHKLDISTTEGPVAKYRCKKCGRINLITLNRPDDSAAIETREHQRIGSVHGQDNDGNDTLDGAELLQSNANIHPQISGFSIKTKITFVITALIVVSLSTVGFIASKGGSNALSQQAEQHLALISSQKATEYNNIFTRIQNEMEGIAIYAQQTFARNTFAEDLQFDILMPWNGSTYGNPQETGEISTEILALQRVGTALQGLVQKNPYLELGYMATTSNAFVMDNEEIVGVIAAEQGFIPTQRPWYEDAVKKKGTIWTQPYVDVNTKNLIVSCATPVYSKAQTLIGVVGFDVLLDTIQKDIISLDIGYDSQAFLIGKTGDFLVKPGMGSTNIAWNQTVQSDNALQTDNADFKNIVKNMMVGKSGIGTHVEAGNRVIIAYAPLTAIDASVGIAVSEKEVMRPATDIQKLIMAVWVGVVILSIFVGLLIGNSITKPINKLTMQADLISQGKMDLEEISENRKDEIGVLIEAFNRLVSSLKIAMSRKRK
jgi:two-component system, sensor histidine kinase and response regulator